MNKSRLSQIACVLAIGFFLSVFFLSEAPARDCSPGCCELVPDTWSPSLEQVGDFLDESARADVKAPQQTLNLNSQNRADIRDAQLFVVYIELMQRLNARKRAELFKEQKRWLGKRNEYAEMTVVSRGGSLAPVEYNAAFRVFTEDRLLQLQKRLQQQPKCKTTKK